MIDLSEMAEAVNNALAEGNVCLVGTASDQATAWLWGVNGACGVLASVSAVAISMWFGIHRNLWLAAVAYALVAVLLHALQWRLGTRGTRFR